MTKVKDHPTYYYYIWINRNSEVPDMCVGPINNKSAALDEAKSRFEPYRKDGLVKVSRVCRESIEDIYSVGVVADLS